MSNNRDQLHNAVAGFGVDAAMYNGEQLPEDIFDDMDDSGALLREIDALKQQLAEVDNQATSLDNMQIGRFGLTTTGLIVPEDATAEEFGHVGQMLFRLEGSLQWLIGDWLVLVDGYQWGDTGALAAHFGRKAQTLYNMKMIAKNVQFSLRKENLSYGHHALVSKFDAGLQAYWLDKAERGDADPIDGDVRIRWSVSRLRNEIKMADLPALSAGSSPEMFNFARKKKEIGKFGRSVMKARQGDDKAKRDALGWIAEQRQWLENIEGLLNDG